MNTQQDDEGAAVTPEEDGPTTDEAPLDEEELADEASAESFPSSDPPASY